MADLRAMHPAQASGEEIYLCRCICVSRTGRTCLSIGHIIESLQRKKVSVRILNLGMDTATPTGKLMLTVLGAVAQFEREVMLERQREGIAKAKGEGKYKGRKPLADDKVQNVIKLASAGIDRQSIAEQLHVGVASVYRILARHRSQVVA